MMRVLTAPSSFWTYDAPRDRGATYLLLTISSVLVKGRWYGEHNEYFIAWAPMPSIDHDIERKLREERKNRRIA